MSPEMDGYVTINGRRYPSNYPPGQNQALDEAWRALDLIKDGVIRDDVRAYLAGVYAGALERERDKRKPLTKWLIVAFHALRSYGHDNGSPVLAKAIADDIEGVLRFEDPEWKP